MKLLVACAECHRQFDASDLAATSRFRCTCGQIVVVPEAKGHEAAVVRCSACGGPRKGNATICGYCQAEFTLHEQDLRVLCAHCMTRVSNKARFCHHCATPVAPEGAAGKPSKQLCPVCEPNRHLSSRELGKERLPFWSVPAAPVCGSDKTLSSVSPSALETGLCLTPSSDRIPQAEPIAPLA